jgi:hypothetical protein
MTGVVAIYILLATLGEHCLRVLDHIEMMSAIALIRCMEEKGFPLAA